MYFHMSANVVSGTRGSAEEVESAHAADVMLHAAEVMLQDSQYALRIELKEPQVRFRAGFAVGPSDVVHIFTKGESMVRLQVEMQGQPDSEVDASARAQRAPTRRAARA
jgi:hypothetical protein